MKVTTSEEVYEVEKGDYLFIPKGVPHKYENISDTESQFICIIPAVEDRHSELLED
ncbi:hypothetical protein C9439_01190 [archaeon SCG-AAA382B04]|nr:hypothetical protein C9439_01190 [archaeon SCG-AAA382B04]